MINLKFVENSMKISNPIFLKLSKPSIQKVLLWLQNRQPISCTEMNHLQKYSRSFQKGFTLIAKLSQKFPLFPKEAMVFASKDKSITGFHRNAL